MQKKGVGGVDFVDKAIITLTQSGANALTFEQLHFGLSIKDKYGLIIRKIEFAIAQGTVSLMTATADAVSCALVRSNTITDLSLSQPQVIDRADFVRMDFGTAGSAQFWESPPLVRDFTNMPGGGLIVPPDPIYVAMDSSGLASAGTLTTRIFYNLAQLKPEEYWQLVESMNIITA